MLLLELLNINKKNKILNLNNIHISMEHNKALFEGYLVFNKLPNLYDFNCDELVLVKNKNSGKIYVVNSDEIVKVNTNICEVLEVNVKIEKYWYDGHGGHDVDTRTETYFIAISSDIKNVDNNYLKELIEQLDAGIGHVSVISIKECI